MEISVAACGCNGTQPGEVGYSLVEVKRVIYCAKMLKDYLMIPSVITTARLVTFIYVDNRRWHAIQYSCHFGTKTPYAV